jgi:hypothetical protein
VSVIYFEINGRKKFTAETQRQQKKSETNFKEHFVPSAYSARSAVKISLASVLWV